ncbi:MAG: hypothetical protein ACPG4T_24550, partial [Nannocystaceae bacterium]
MKIKMSTIQKDGSWSTASLLSVVYQPPQKGEWVQLADDTWYEVVNVVHMCFGFDPVHMDGKVVEDRLKPYGDKIGSMEDITDMTTVDVV